MFRMTSNSDQTGQPKGQATAKYIQTEIVDINVDTIKGGKLEGQKAVFYQAKDKDGNVYTDSDPLCWESKNKYLVPGLEKSLGIPTIAQLSKQHPSYCNHTGKPLLLKVTPNGATNYYSITFPKEGNTNGSIGHLEGLSSSELAQFEAEMSQFSNPKKDIDGDVPPF